MRHLRIFVSSSGDVLNERIIGAEVIGNLEYEAELRGKITASWYHEKIATK